MEKSPVRSDAYFPEWKPAFTDVAGSLLRIPESSAVEGICLG